MNRPPTVLVDHASWLVAISFGNLLRVAIRCALAAALLAPSACLLHFKPHERTNEEREAESRAQQSREDDEAKALRLLRIKNAHGTPNPVVTGSVDRTSKGAEAFTYEREDWAAWLSSYAGDTLCFGLRHVEDATSDRRPGFDAAHFQLFAPDTIRAFEGTPTMTATRVNYTNFDARFTESRYAEQPDGSVSRRDHYQLDERFEVCFDEASHVVTPASAYVLLRFAQVRRDYFELFWRFGAES